MATNNLDISYLFYYPDFIFKTNRSGLFMHKKCSRCNEEKDMKKFKVDKRQLDGRTITCRSCYTYNKLEKFFRTPLQIESHRNKLKGRKYSLKHRLAISLGNIKSHRDKTKNSLVSSDPDHFRMRVEYQRWREDIISLRGNKCEMCDGSYRIQVHHIKCYYKYPELRTSLDNGQVLCQSCHLKITWQERKKVTYAD